MFNSANPMDPSPLRAKILETIVLRKSSLKQQVFDNTFATFNELKDILFEMSSEWDDELDGRIDRRVRIEYRDRGRFETQFQVASDLLIFRMHTDVFEFDANHLVGRAPTCRPTATTPTAGSSTSTTSCRTRSSSTATPTKAT